MKIETEGKHMPTPWAILEYDDGKGIYPDRSLRFRSCYKVRSKEYGTIAECGENKANAAFIVRAVNSHETLLQAAKKALAVLQGCNPYGLRDSNPAELKDYARRDLQEAIAQADEGK